jgi:DtxR family transcriptional regulator, manganese transport regulator
MEKVHARTRKDHSTELAEDYVEAISDIVDQNGVCRAVDLVNHFAVTHATVNNTISRLVRDGLAHTEPYQPIQLTTRGKRLAVTCKDRHRLVESFLLAMGVSPAIAELDSEGIEHHVSKETLAAMKSILKNGWPIQD